MNNTIDIRRGRNLLSVEKLRVTYRVGKIDVHALRGVDLHVREGEFVAIMGPSGCGKSTLLHSLGGLLRPSSGTIEVNGTDISAVSDAERTRIRRDQIGFVFQRFNLLPTLSARDNIRLAQEIRGSEYTPDEVERLIGMLGLKHKLEHKPTELSGGEQQRVAIARALINRPTLLLADEPTGNLDSDNSEAVLELLTDLNREQRQTILMITHDAEVASKAGRIIEMRDGKILNRVENLYYTMDQRS